MFGALDSLAERRRSYIMLRHFDKADAVPAQIELSSKERQRIADQARLDAASLRSVIEKNVRDALSGVLASSEALTRAQAAATIDGVLASFLEEPGQDLRSFISESIDPEPVAGSQEWIDWEQQSLPFIKTLDRHRAAIKRDGREIAIKKTTENGEIASAWWKAYNDGIRSASLDAADVGKFVYSAILDGRACPVCRAFDGVTLPKRHPWWESRTPPNHRRCRCRIIALTWDQIDDLDIQDSKRLPTSIDQGPGNDPLPAVPSPGFGGDGTRFDPLLRVGPGSGQSVLPLAPRAKVPPVSVPAKSLDPVRRIKLAEGEGIADALRRRGVLVAVGDDIVETTLRPAVVEIEGQAVDIAEGMTPDQIDEIEQAVLESKEG